MLWIVLYIIMSQTILLFCIVHYTKSLCFKLLLAKLINGIFHRDLWIWYPVICNGKLYSVHILMSLLIYVFILLFFLEYSFILIIIVCCIAYIYLYCFYFFCISMLIYMPIHNVSLYIHFILFFFCYLLIYIMIIICSFLWQCVY